MNESILEKYGIRQLGYYVKNIEETAQIMAEVMGAGPFIDMGVNPCKSLLVRGKESKSLVRVAMGHVDDIQLELIELQNDEPNVYSEMGHYGLHHICMWSDDVDATVKALAAYGIEVAMDMESSAGMHVVYVDARDQFGTYIEIHQPLEQLFQGIKALHDNWDGTRPLRPVSELMGK
ncbi:MAG: VOC family protein [Coriobacteriales bacterium]|jgi:hypothetical protein